MPKGFLLEITVRTVSRRRGPPRSGLALALVGAFVAGGWLGGCARATPPPEQPPANAPLPGSDADAAQPAAPSPTELDSLEQELLRSEERLNAELARQHRLAATAPPPAPGAPADSAGSEPKKSAESASGDAEAPARRPRGPSEEIAASANAAADDDGRQSPCDLGCRALASMQRARARICEIAGPGARCQAAVDRVAAAAERVRAAGCECSATEHE